MRVLHVNERAGFYVGVEQMLYDIAGGLGARGMAQARLHADQEPRADHPRHSPTAALKRRWSDVSRFHRQQPDEAIAAAIARPLADRDLRACVVRRGLDRAASVTWDHAAAAVLAALDGLASGASRRKA